MPLHPLVPFFAKLIIYPVLLMLAMMLYLKWLAVSAERKAQAACQGYVVGQPFRPPAAGAEAIQRINDLHYGRTFHWPYEGASSCDVFIDEKGVISEVRLIAEAH